MRIGCCSEIKSNACFSYLILFSMCWARYFRPRLKLQVTLLSQRKPLCLPSIEGSIWMINLWRHPMFSESCSSYNSVLGSWCSNQDLCITKTCFSKGNNLTIKFWLLMFSVILILILFSLHLKGRETGRDRRELSKLVHSLNACSKSLGYAALKPGPKNSVHASMRMAGTWALELCLSGCGLAGHCIRSSRAGLEPCPPLRDLCSAAMQQTPAPDWLWADCCKFWVFSSVKKGGIKIHFLGSLWCETGRSSRVHEHVTCTKGPLGVKRSAVTTLKC